MYDLYIKFTFLSLRSLLSYAWLCHIMEVNEPTPLSVLFFFMKTFCT